MTQFTVDSEALTTSSGAARTTIGQIQSQVAGLNSQLAALESSWTGQAASAFQSAAADWRGHQQRIEELLTALSQALGQAGQLYAETEAANARLFGH